MISVLNKISFRNFFSFFCFVPLQTKEILMWIPKYCLISTISWKKWCIVWKKCKGANIFGHNSMCVDVCASCCCWLLYPHVGGLQEMEWRPTSSCVCMCVSETNYTTFLYRLHVFLPMLWYSHNQDRASWTLHQPYDHFINPSSTLPHLIFYPSLCLDHRKNTLVDVFPLVFQLL